MSDVRMKGFTKRTSVTDAWALIEARVGPLGSERVPFRSALGRILAEDVTADRNVPPHPRSAMDGYAVRSADLPGTLEVLGELMAAEVFEGTLGRGQAMRIMTGAKVPDGADCVVMVEDTRAEEDRVVIDGAAAPGQHILQTGEDLREGKVVLARGRRLRPQDLSMLVTVSALEVLVRRRPRVRIIPTGTELVRAGVRPTGSQVVESNSHMLEALALRDGAEVAVHPIVSDDRELLARALQEPGADVVVVTGGSSVGLEDYAPVVVRELGELPIHGIAVKPASPTAIGFLGRTAVVLAPGFPVASFVAWDLFVRPILQRLAGAPVRLPYEKTRVRLTQPYEKPPQRVDVARVVLHPSSDGPALASVLPGGAALLSTVTRADAFLLLEAGTGRFEAGTELDAHLYA